MILCLGKNVSPELVQKTVKRLSENALESSVVKSGERTLVVVVSACDHLPGHFFAQMDGVEKVVKLTNRTPLASEAGCSTVSFGPSSLDGSLSKVVVGRGRPIIIAGPCSVESAEQVLAIAEAIKPSAQALRGGAFKPRTSPYDFQGLGLDGLKLLSQAGLRYNLPVVSEILTPDQVEEFEPYVDVFQVGARNMYNYELLKELGRQSKPVLLKRAMSATIDELLQSAEYILLAGNLQVILCERGIRTFETRVRNTLDLSAVVALKSLTSLPVIVDPSHGTGKRDYVRAMARAAIACGADGLIIECHVQPDNSISDAAQAISPEALREIAGDVEALYAALRDRDTSVDCRPALA